MSKTETQTQTKGINLSGLNLKKEEVVDPVVDPVVKVEEPTPEVAAQATPEVVTEVEKTYHVFYNTISSCKMLTESGRVIAFVKGKYITDQQEEIDYLNKEIAAGTIYLSVIPGQEVMTATELDPMAMIRKKHFEEFKAEQAALAHKIATGEGLTSSTSEVQKLVPGSTADVAKLAAGSGS